MPVKTMILPSVAQLRARWSYDPDTGIVIDLMNGMVYHKQGPDGYLIGYIDGLMVRMHRVIWKMMTGEDPHPLEVDHRDGDQSNMRWRNLRIATRSQQRMNSSVQSNNQSGVKGVWPRANGRWVARIQANGVNHHLGTFSRIEDAIAARQAAERIHHGEWSHGAR